jgi:hypothetical protein
VPPVASSTAPSTSAARTGAGGGGAKGEERVASQLVQLDDRWAVVHDLTIGRKGANLDHLVIGPAGVFVLNTKNLTGKLTVYEHAILHNGHKTAFVPAALREVRPSRSVSPPPPASRCGRGASSWSWVATSTSGRSRRT